MSREELLTKYRDATTQVGKHKATNNVFLDKVIGSLISEAERHQPWDGSGNATSELLKDAAATLVWSVWWRELLSQKLDEANKDYLHLQHKVAHGCTDASCKECDQ